MQKLMTLRFAGKCKRCNVMIPAGERAYYLGSKNGIQHLTCTPDKPPVIGKPDTTEIEGVTFDFNEVVAAFKHWQVTPEPTLKHRKNYSSARALAESWKDRGYGYGGTPWAGCTIPEMNGWIADGYRVEGLSEVQSLIPTKPRRKIRHGEEGDELLIDLAWSGDDKPFIEWEKRQSKPGLSVEIDMTFHAGVAPKLITEYQTWIARALQTLDDNGVAMDVSLVVKTSGADSENYGKVLAAKIRVAKAGESTGFASWSAMFSPGGFRMLGIMSTGLMVDRLGGTISSGYGSPRPLGRWDIQYDDVSNVLKIGADTGGSFPSIEMTEKLVTVLSTLTGR